MMRSTLIPLGLGARGAGPRWPGCGTRRVYLFFETGFNIIDFAGLKLTISTGLVSNFG